MFQQERRPASPAATIIKWAGFFLSSTFLYIIITQQSDHHRRHHKESTPQLRLHGQHHHVLRDVELEESDQDILGGSKEYYDHHLYNYPHHHQEYKKDHHEQTTTADHDRQHVNQEGDDTDVEFDQQEQQELKNEEQDQQKDVEPEKEEELKINNLDDRQQEHGTNDDTMTAVEWTCIWSPTSHDQCNELLSQRLTAIGGALNRTSSTSSSSTTQRQRWLFFGDSTMSRLFMFSNLGEVLVHNPYKSISSNNISNSDTDVLGGAATSSIGSSSSSCWSGLECEIRHSNQCELYTAFGFDKAEKWRKPSFFPNFEGPVSYGYKHPYCSDCQGCDTAFLHCTSNNGGGDGVEKEEKNDEDIDPFNINFDFVDGGDVVVCEEEKLAYGGYMMVEFAKDVELQTSLFTTTQENTAYFIHEHYNTPALVEKFGKPICVVSTGFHDMTLLVKSTHFGMERFVENVKWYLTKMQEVCSHIVWLTNAAPSAENPKNWPQTIERTYQWNQGVKEMIEENDYLLEMTTFVDLFQASIIVPHLKDDHIHKVDSWYENVGQWFSSIITKRNKMVVDDQIIPKSITSTNDQTSAESIGFSDDEILTESISSNIGDGQTSVESIGFDDDEILTESIGNIGNGQTSVERIGLDDDGIFPESISYTDDQDSAKSIRANDDQSPTSFTIPDWSCEWSPTSHEECYQLLSQRLPYVNDTSSGNLIKRQRWLFFGDSTVKRQFTVSNLNSILIDRPHKLNSQVNPCWSNLNCEVRHADRCGMSTVFDFHHPREWKKPKLFPNFEGPASYGSTHPYCSDCVGCDPEFLHCEKRDDKQGFLNFGLDYGSASIDKCKEEKLVYGGFMVIEYARDVELQTADFRTTQENTAWYIHQHYNTPELLETWGKPICVISTGFHDMILLVKTDHFNIEKYIENVVWYLSIMKEVCSHIVWMTNTAPSTENPKNWPQTIEVTNEWNQAVKDTIEKNYELLEMATFLDVFQASLSIPQLTNDHIHKTDSWYKDIGYWFSSVITEKMSDVQFMDS